MKLARQPSPALAAAAPADPAIPWAALVLSSLAVVLYPLPGWSAGLGYDRDAVAAGQLWRLLTGHWTHWSAEHLSWNLLVFALLGVFWERTGERRRLLVCVLGSAFFISAASSGASPSALATWALPFAKRADIRSIKRPVGSLSSVISYPVCLLCPAKADSLADCVSSYLCCQGAAQAACLG